MTIKLIERFDAIEKLEYDWNGYGAEPIPKETIERAKKLFELLEPFEYQPEVFPIAGGGIQIEWHINNGYEKSYSEICVYSDKTTVYGTSE